MRGGHVLRGRGELTDTAWRRISPLLPENGRRGKQWRDHRRVIDGILWRLRIGAPWRDIPECYGPWQTCAMTVSSDAEGEIVREVSVDSTVCRAHQHASGARKRPSQKDLKKGNRIRPTKHLVAAAAD